MTPEREAEIRRKLANAEGRYGPAVDSHTWRHECAEVLAALDAERAERAAMESWDGLMRLLDRVAPEDIFPTAEDSPTRDPGPRLASALRLLDAERKAHEETRRERVCGPCATTRRRAVTETTLLVAAALAESERAEARAEKAERERDAAEQEAKAAIAAAEENADAVLRYEDRVRLERERDEAQAALVGLREAATGCPYRYCTMYGEGSQKRRVRVDPARSWCDCLDRLSAALSSASAPATLAGQVRARVLREAADAADTISEELSALANWGNWLRALADEAEKTR